MRLAIVAGGKVRERHVRESIDDYLGRIRRYLPLDEIEVRQGKDKKAAKAMERAIPKGFETWVLDVQGKEPTSPQLAEWIKNRLDHGAKGLCFLIGGADGLPPQLRRDADRLISLSRLTLPHRLARLLLAEQIYRSLTILRGEPYSK